MNNYKDRKYARCVKKSNSSSDNGYDEEELSISSTAALGILGGTFIVGLISGKLLSMLMKSK
ncbi:hypothetical protein EHE19_012455 [Ruminiclostridium herbifermentans]|uniref:Uncharacterized protein n=1 Tax=Ruminiclostridium herbifermentans TaxID=2488810 RepID=A0A4V6ENT8_9FIRM|nr:hypothetical protein [Ruminiclostridium herbifermentans]QNU65726.1 hypothetical protein EHE19_012455 [Ruminiclostridium herbifermentans]